MAVFLLSIVGGSVGVYCRILNGVSFCNVEDGALKACRCNDVKHVTEIYCRKIGLTGVPNGLPSTLIKL